MALFFIAETGEEVDLACKSRNGQDVAIDVMTAYGADLTLDEFGERVISESDYDWWSDILERLEKLEQTSIDWSSNIEWTSDLGELVDRMEKFAQETA